MTCLPGGIFSYGNEHGRRAAGDRMHRATPRQREAMQHGFNDFD